MFTIEYATLEDMPSIMNIITESLPFIPDSDWFVGDTEEFYARHIADAGFILKAISNSSLNYFIFLISLNKTASGIDKTHANHITYTPIPILILPLLFITTSTKISFDRATKYPVYLSE